MTSDTGVQAAADTARPRARGSRWIFAAAAAALVVVVLAALYTRAAAPLELGDPGPGVRWGIPVMNVVRDLAAALTVGTLLLGGFLVPEGAETRRRAVLARYAAWSATAWSLTAATSVVLGYSDLSGTRLTDAGFAGQAWPLIWQLETLRSPAIMALMAAAVALLAFIGPGARGMAWLFALSLTALYPLALIGHAAGSDDHEAAVDSLLVHLLAVSVWVGGLLALLLMWGRLGKGTPAVVRRYSTVALWCFCAVALSGTLNAIVRVGSLGNLASRYGVLVLVKVTLLVVLGLFGWQHRRRVVDRLEGGDSPGRALFARLAGMESLVMGAAIALGVTLSRSAPPVPETIRTVDAAYNLTGYRAPAAPQASSWVTLWRVEWLLSSIAVVAIVVYLVWAWRLHHRGDKWPVLRTVSWCIGWLIFLYMVDGAPAIYGRVMFSVHMLGHMTISMLVPIFLVRGGVVTLALRALPKRSDKTLGLRELILTSVHSKILGKVANPAVAAVFVFVSLIIFYYSPLFNLALTTHTGHLLMTLHFMASGYLYAWALVGIDPGPTRWAPPIRLVILLMAITFHAFFGVALMTGDQLLGGDFFTLIQLPYVTDAITDQQRGGTIAWGAGELPTFMIAMLIAAEWYRKDTAEGERQSRQADRDDDAQLRAYNDYLATRAGRGSQS
ncbi:MAG: cytochrome c oxidase assembly protein [Allobranchiibius sp.]